MKRAATGVVCLAAAWSGAYAHPVKRHGEHHTQAAETLGDVMRNAVQDAIRGAVTKVVQAHHTSVSSPVHDVAFEPHALTQRASLRGRAAKKAETENPWEPVKPLRIMDHNLSPTAPANRLQPGIEAQKGLVFPPGYWPRAVYYDDHKDQPNPFPHHYNPPVPDKPQNFFVCHTSPGDWVDKKGIGCSYYETALWCTKENKMGIKWQKSWGSLMTFAVKNVSALEACCECGGGAQQTVIGGAGESPLEERRLLAPADRLPDPKARWFEKNNGHFTVPGRPLRPLQAPEDYVPMPIKQVAQEDKVPMKYSRYFRELHNQNQKEQPRGFSVQYYTAPPKDCKSTPKASELDLSLDYQDTTYDAASLLGLNTSIDFSPVGLDAKSLSWPGKNAPFGGLFWAKWSGTIDIVAPGNYIFDLNVGFDTNSWFKVDGQEMVTVGQCSHTQDKKVCGKKKGCSWKKEDGACMPTKMKGNAAAPKPTAACKKGTYRTSAVLFGCSAKNGEVEVTVGPTGATTVLTVPKGVKNFRIAVESTRDLDLRIKDLGSKAYIVKFDNGIVNSQQLHGTFHGMAVSWSGDGDLHESAVLNGVTTAPIEVSLMSYQTNPTTVKLIYGHDGLNPCPGKGKVAGCKKFSPADGQKEVVKWSGNLVGRYGQCSHAWEAVIKAYPGGQISWTQWESIWASAYGTNSAHGNGWKIGFAVIDSSHDGYIQQAEFMAGCSMGIGAPSPAPAPQVLKSGTGGRRFATLNTCLGVKILDKASWPKDSFKGTGYKDHPILSELVGSPQLVVKASKKGVLVASPDGKQKWFYPKGTFYCVQVAGGPSAASAPSPMVSSGGPAPSITDIVPIIIGGTAKARTLLQEQEDASGGDGAVYLGSGGHCIEAMVMVTPTARNLRLLYTGPDTKGEESVIPGQMMNCDPIIPACTEPLREACLNYRPQCSAAPAPAPASAPSAR